MKTGIVLPSWEARPVAHLARDAENAGWDGIFLWEPVWGFDAWVLLGAAATLTERIRLGTMLTPPSRMRPWKLASETLTLDHLSNGRVILSAGLGAVDTGFEAFGEITDRKTRAELMDESLEILTRLWSGKSERFQGKHYSIRPLKTFPSPPPIVQRPRIPIWVVGAWPREKSMQRALRYDGLLPNVMQPDGSRGRPTIEDVRGMRAYADERRSGLPYDIIVEGVTPGNPQEAGKVVRPWSEAGATWWIEADWEVLNSPGAVDATRRRILQGPPAVQA